MKHGASFLKLCLPLGLIVGLALALAACATLERPPVDKRFYALETVRPGPAGSTGPADGGAAASPDTLLVRRLQISPRAAGRELVYRTGESAWTADYYNLFFVSPADMLTQDLRAWLSAARLCANVVDPGSLAQAGYILEGNVTSLYGDFSPSSGKGPAQAVVEAQFLLLRPTGGERQIVLARAYRKTAPLASNTPQELVRALRVAVSGVYADLEADLRQALVRK